MQLTTRARLLLCVGVMASAALLAGCGGGDDDNGSDAKSGTTQAQASNPAAKADGCPLSAEQVSDALGATVEKDAGACTYFPAGDNVTPNAAFNRQHSFICDEPERSDAGYKEALDGLTEKAYVQPDTALGTMILVCSKNTFEITVDMAGGSGPEIEAGKKLAALVLAGE
jgi:hypothetical protein